MSSTTETADRVSSWSGYPGVKLPKSLVDALAVFDALRWIEVGRQPVFSLDGITAANAEQRLREYADELVVADVPGGGLSVLGKAKKDAVEDAAQRAVNVARGAVRSVIEQLTPSFEVHAAAYVEAVSLLPDTLTAETLVSAGPSVVAAYQAAKAEAHALNRYDSWVAGLVGVEGVLPRDIEVALRVIRPANVIELARLDEATTLQASQVVRELDPTFLVAARLGCTWEIHTIQECAQIRKDLETPKAPVKGFMTMAS